MQSIRIRGNWPVIALLAVIAALLGGRSLGVLGPGPEQPAVIATADLERVFNSLDQRTQARAELDELASELEARRDEMKQHIEQLEADVEVYAEGSEAQQEAMDQWTLAALRLQGWVEMSGRKLDAEGSRMMGEIYQSIKDAAAEMADLYGYDIVFVDDSRVALPQNIGETELTRQISARRMLYTSPRIDITDELIKWMNDRFSAQQ